KETVAQTSQRLAAGVGVVAACLMVGGPSAAVAIASPGSGHDGRSGDGKGSDSSDRAGSDYSDDNIRAGTNSETGGRPSTRVGSGRESGTSDERPSSDYSPDSPQSNGPKVTFGDGR